MFSTVSAPRAKQSKCLNCAAEREPARGRQRNSRCFNPRPPPPARTADVSSIAEESRSQPPKTQDEAVRWPRRPPGREDCFSRPREGQARPRLLPSGRPPSKPGLSRHRVRGAEEQFKTRLGKFFPVTEGTGCCQSANKLDKKNTGTVWFQTAGENSWGVLNTSGNFFSTDRQFAQSVVGFNIFFQ